MPDLPIVAPGYAPEEPEAEDLSGCLTNTCVLNRAVLTETMQAAMNRPFFRVLRVGEPLLALLCLGLLIWAVTDGQPRYAIWCGFLLVMLGFFYVQQFLLYPKKAVKNQLLRQLRDDGAAELENRLYFTQESVANRRGDSAQVLHMDYGKIRRVTETERLIVLTTRTRRLIPLDKSGFENGTVEDLNALLQAKCPKLRLGTRDADVSRFPE
ncbi:MAG: YcxB family protein [Oscillospiraceae bacterium]|nr:YcxB family protein [Oscillospiraceae bacterium]